MDKRRTVNLLGVQTARSANGPKRGANFLTLKWNVFTDVFMSWAYFAGFSRCPPNPKRIADSSLS